MATDTETAPATEEPPAAEPPAAEPAKKAGKAKDAKKADEKAGKGDKKDKKSKKDKKDKGEDEPDEADAGGPSVAAHPRAARAVASAKGWGGLAGFVLGGYLSLPTNTVAAAGLRALIAGVVCYVAAWAGAVFLWRRLVMLEIKGREQQIVAARTANQRRELPPGRPERQGAGAAS
jgi:hypothetical protein